jgi:hypothetical protein
VTALVIVAALTTAAALTTYTYNGGADNSDNAQQHFDGRIVGEREHTKQKNKSAKR